MEIPENPRPVSVATPSIRRVPRPPVACRECCRRRSPLIPATTRSLQRVPRSPASWLQEPSITARSRSSESLPTQSCDGLPRFHSQHPRHSSFAN
ncbi:hypothetical protein KSP40_PGU002701 [Platanthera guangdongensis]|uniref:Uncharacterized protein n=1 Tax=Platanthera guangdongensis TaxID=2320717 RepID=A0ABR2ME86_9ASPA